MTSTLTTTTNFIVDFCESLEFQYLHPFLSATDVIKLGFLTKKIKLKTIIKQLMSFYNNNTPKNNTKEKHENIIYLYTSHLQNTIKISCFTYIDNYSTTEPKLLKRYNIVVDLVSAPSVWCFNSNSGTCLYTQPSQLRCEHYHQRKYRSLYFEMNDDDNNDIIKTGNKTGNNSKTKDFKLFFKIFCKIQNTLTEKSKTTNINTREYFNTLVLDVITPIKNKSTLIW
jgi:hypothetical protein